MKGTAFISTGMCPSQCPYGNTCQTDWFCFLLFPRASDTTSHVVHVQNRVKFGGGKRAISK